MASDSLPNEQVSIELAKIYFKDVKNRLGKIYAIATRAKLAEESLGEDDSNPITIAIFGAIEDIAENYSSIYKIEEYFEAASKSGDSVSFKVADHD